LDQFCFSCHGSIREDLDNGIGHEPVVDGACLDCHNPHDSPHASLMTDDISTLCLNCHDGDDEQFRDQHLGQSGEEMDCRKCHNPHAAEAENLIRPNQHDPFEGRACEACHQPDGQPGGQG